MRGLKLGGRRNDSEDIRDKVIRGLGVPEGVLYPEGSCREGKSQPQPSKWALQCAYTGQAFYKCKTNCCPYENSIHLKDALTFLTEGEALDYLKEHKLKGYRVKPV